jgi:hypothetical protein
MLHKVVVTLTTIIITWTGTNCFIRYPEAPKSFSHRPVVPASLHLFSQNFPQIITRGAKYIARLSGSIGNAYIRISSCAFKNKQVPISWRNL